MRVRARNLLPLVILFLVVGGGMLHCAHAGSLCGFSEHDDIKHHQMTPPICFMLVLILWLMFPWVSTSYYFLWQKTKDNLQFGHPAFLFRPPRLKH